MNMHRSDGFSIYAHRATGDLSVNRGRVSGAQSDIEDRLRLSAGSDDSSSSLKSMGATSSSASMEARVFLLTGEGVTMRGIERRGLRKRGGGRLANPMALGSSNSNGINSEGGTSLEDPKEPSLS